MTALDAATNTTSVWTQITATLTQPETIPLSGAMHIVTQITTPVDPCYLVDPCRVPLTVNVNLAGVNGVGAEHWATVSRDRLGNGDGYDQHAGRICGERRFQSHSAESDRAAESNHDSVFMTADSSGNVTASASQPQGLVSWWQAEADTNDALGNNNAVNHGALFGPGRVGQAFRFGTFDILPYVEAPGSPSLQPANVTVMAWVRSLGTPGGGQYVLVEGARGCLGGAYALYTGNSGNLSFYVSDGGTFLQSPDAPAAVWDGAWHVAAGTYDGATVRFYLDGVQIGNGTAAANALSYAAMDHSNFGIGAYRGNTCTLGFTGSIDEVRLFNRALTSPEILGIYQVTQ